MIPNNFHLSSLAHTTTMQIFARRLAEELHLRHVIVDGVDEYAV